MDCNCQVESGTDIVKPMVTDSSHWISGVRAPINIRCITSCVPIINECTMLASYITIAVVILI